MKHYKNGNVLSVALPITIGLGDDDRLATAAVNNIYSSLRWKGWDVKTVYVDSSWARMSEFAEWAKVPQKVTAMIHLVFDSTVGKPEVVDSIEVAQRACKNWQDPFLVWSPMEQAEMHGQLHLDDILQMLE